jgi:ESCRT-II complex subunit VPS36
MASKWLPAAEITSSGRPVLFQNEIESSFLSSVDLECDDLPNFPLLKSGLLILTTHRLLWLPDSSSTSSSTTTSTSSSTAVAVPLSLVTHIFSTKKSLKNLFHSPRVRLQASLDSRSVVMTVVMRGKGDPDVFLAKFWENWRARAWEADAQAQAQAAGSGSNRGEESGSGSGGFYTREGAVRMVGVSGILRKEQEMWESTDKSLQEAFQDLNALMVIILLFLFVYNLFLLCRKHLGKE